MECTNCIVYSAFKIIRPNGANDNAKPMPMMANAAVNTERHMS